jgi:deoxyhypusine synthase
LQIVLLKNPRLWRDSRMGREQFLRHPTHPLEVSPDKDISALVREMGSLGFQGRKLSEAADVWTSMLKKREIVIWMGVTGAMIPAGMRRLIAHLIQRRMIDILVTTGANLYHEAYETLGGRHFLGSDVVDDVRLHKYRIDRMYDVYADEKRFYTLDLLIEKEFASTLRDDYRYSTRQVMEKFGKWLQPRARDKDSINIVAYENGIPVFVPAMCDSSFGFSLAFANRRRNRRIIVDHLRDVDESSKITERSRSSGVVIVGGGVPKNFIQQTAVIASYQTRHDRTHSYALQMTTDVPQWGGLSGSTFEEAQSWGKYHSGARVTQCLVDATIALPIIAHALTQRFRKLTRRVPIFDWSGGNLRISYEKRKL